MCVLHVEVRVQYVNKEDRSIQKLGFILQTVFFFFFIVTVRKQFSVSLGFVHFPFAAWAQVGLAHSWNSQRKVCTLSLERLNMVLGCQFSWFRSQSKYQHCYNGCAKVSLAQIWNNQSESLTYFIGWGFWKTCTSTMHRKM